MTPTQASEIIGCSASHVRLLIRTGVLSAERVLIMGGYAWDIPPEEADWYRDKPQSRGWPRGQSRD